MNTNNKIIAEFMEFKSTNKCVRSESGKYYDYHANQKFSCIKEQEIQIESENGFGLVEQDYLFIEDLKFHSDWSWLMEVVEKIESLGHAFSIDSTKCYVLTNDFCNAQKEATKIESVYKVCVEFIKWYNLNK